MSPVDRDSVMARLLRIVRAGTIAPSAVYERSPAAYNHVPEAIKAGWIERDADGDLRITAAGRAACPCANPLAETTPRPAAAPQKRVPAAPITRESPMKPKTGSTADQVLQLIKAAGHDGIGRKDLVKKLPKISDGLIDAAIAKLVREGEAHRPCYGRLCIGKAPKTEAPAPAEPSVRELLAENAEKREAREVREARDIEDMPGSVFTDDPRPMFDARFLRAQAETMEPEHPLDVVSDRAVDVARWQEELIVPTLGSHVGGGRFELTEPLILIGSDRKLRIREGGVELILSEEQTAELAQLMAALPVTTERRAA